MTLRDQWITDGRLFNPNDANTFPFGAESVLYTPNGGAEISIPATVDEADEVEDEENGVIVSTQVIQVSVEDVPTPTTYDVVKVRGRRCKVDGIDSPVNGSHVLTLIVGNPV